VGLTKVPGETGKAASYADVLKRARTTDPDLYASLGIKGVRPKGSADGGLLLEIVGAGVDASRKADRSADKLSPREAARAAEGPASVPGSSRSVYPGVGPEDDSGPSRREGALS